MPAIIQSLHLLAKPTSNVSRGKMPLAFSFGREKKISSVRAQFFGQSPKTSKQRRNFLGCPHDVFNATPVRPATPQFQINLQWQCKKHNLLLCPPAVSQHQKQLQDSFLQFCFHLKHHIHHKIHFQ